MGQIHPQRLATDCSRWIVSKKMDAGDERICGQHEVFAEWRPHQRRVVAQTQSRRPGERREISSDEIGFAEARRHGKDESGRARQELAADAGLLAHSKRDVA